MAKGEILIIGGGLAGLSTGIYARMNGYRTRILEHNIALGGVCTAWQRDGYTVDGCIHWLMGGPFDRIYRELGILPRVARRTLERFTTYRNLADGYSVTLTRDLDAFGRDLTVLAPEDAEEIRQMIEGARRIAAFAPPIDHPDDIATLRDRLRTLWDMRHEAPVLLRFRKPFGEWLEGHVQSDKLRHVMLGLGMPEMPALFLLMMLTYLEQGFMSRPVGGSAAFRDALVIRYVELGGEVELDATVDEVLVEGDRVTGVRLEDGRFVAGDSVVSTSSAPETVLRLLGGRYGAEALRDRLERWRLFTPIALVSYGVNETFTDFPAALIVDDLEPFEAGGKTHRSLYLRFYHDAPELAPASHTVVQTLLPTSYEHWAHEGARYGAEKDAVARAVAERIGSIVPGFERAIDMTDVSTPLTFWRLARSWRGAYEGWLPSPDAFFSHPAKTLPGLDRFYMAGQWVEPGGGVPTAVMSGRQLVQILTARDKRAFKTEIAR